MNKNKRKIDKIEVGSISSGSYCQLETDKASQSTTALIT